MKIVKPTIFAIRHHAVQNGPMRITIFFKGCPLSCWWCHNPEGLSRKIEIVTFIDRCLGCGYCVDQCPQEALTLSSALLARDKKRCNVCCNCVETCPVMAHETTGWITTVSSVMEEIEKDIPYFDQSGTGVTFSGGEPLMQPEFLIDLLKECGKLDIHRAVDTSGHVKTDIILEVARHTDIFLYDLKLMDNDRHKLYTGVGNDLILTNIKALAKAGHQLRIRLPLIPGVNVDQENIIRTGSFIVGLPNVTEVDILPYHRTAAADRRRFAPTSPHATFPDVNEEIVQKTRAILENIGLTVRRGS
jgi:pyruvate formate lyase activating enzyme